MKNIFLILISFFSLSSCVRNWEHVEPTDFKYYGPDEYKEIVFEFVELAKHYNTKLQFSQVKIFLVPASEVPKKHKGSAAWAKYYKPEIYINEIFLDNIKSNNAYERNIKATLFHEMGHTLLNRRHVETHYMRFKHENGSNGFYTPKCSLMTVNLGYIQPFEYYTVWAYWKSELFNKIAEKDCPYKEYEFPKDTENMKLRAVGCCGEIDAEQGESEAVCYF